MAEYLRKNSKKVALQICMLLSLGTAAWAATADTLPDPTRPPASLGSLGQGDGAASVSGPVLQSVLISSKQKSAIISGQTVKLGEKFGDARVVRIAESEVVLRSGKDMQTLKLFPDVEKRLVSRRARAKANSAR